MSLKERINSEMKDALKSGDRATVGVLRMVKAKILEREVELRASKGRDYELGDDEVVLVISSYAKQRRQSIESYQQAGREDLVAQEETELRVLQEYLPKQMSADEIEALVKETIAEIGASGPQDLGGVMKAVMPRVKGGADGKVVNEIVRKKLLD